ncbi:MAG: 23S rRNA methyltransferase [Gammaproteobacteria bacterium]|nr:23S rRNA methyltransferase [Gammaproteobacteria bacterium]
MPKRRTPSSARWLAEHESDLYVREARRLGWRSRAIFKLDEIQRRNRILKPGMTVVDLGAAPGGWSQYARPLLGERGRLIALDLLPIEPLPGVEMVLGDFRDQAVLETVRTLLPQRSVHLVMSDMAPNISGVAAADQAAMIGLADLALEFAGARLAAGGDLLVKLFQGEGFEDFVRRSRAAFGSVAIRKPTASRRRSREIYLLARNYRLV